MSHPLSPLKERVAAVADSKARQGRCVGMVMQVLGMIAYIEMRNIAIDAAELAKLEREVAKLERLTPPAPPTSEAVPVLN